MPAISSLKDELEATYGFEIDEHLRKQSARISYCAGLARHGVKPRHRARMVGFMCEALHKVDCSAQTFFRAVDLLDMYFEAATECVPQCELHLLGLACMLIASKYEDRFPLPVDVLRCKVAHSDYSIDDILQMELDILAALNFRVGARPTLLELAERDL